MISCITAVGKWKFSHNIIDCSGVYNVIVLIGHDGYSYSSSRLLAMINNTAI